MTLRRRVVLWLAAVHLALAGIAFSAVRHQPPWLLAVEVLFALSLAASWRLVHLLAAPREVASTGAELLRDEDFQSRFLTVGEAEADRLVALFNRMSDRLREERVRLEEQHLFLAALVEAAPAGVLIADYDGRLTAVNPAAERLLGLPAAELVGHPLDAANPALPPPLGELGDIPPGGSRLLTPTGDRRLRAARGEFFDQGHRRSFVVLEELTGELRAAERAAERATYEKLIRLMSHEVNNSVGAVGSLLETCLELAPQLAAGDRRDFERALEVATGRMGSLRDFVRGFADVVRLPDPRPERCDLGRLVDEVLAVMAGELGRRRIVWRWQPAPPVGRVEVELDKNQFEQVLLNAVQNAAEAIGEDGEIEVEVGRDAGGRPFLAVRDDGPGIAPEARDHLSTPFFSTKAQGRGLGLTLVREVLARHGFDHRLADRPAGGAELVIWMG